MGERMTEKGKPVLSRSRQLDCASSWLLSSLSGWFGRDFYPLAVRLRVSLLRGFVE